MNIQETSTLTGSQKQQILDLWNAEYPAQLQYADINEFDNYLGNLQSPCHLLAIDNNGDIAGWAFSFDREDERWFAIIISGSAQRKGVGTVLLKMLKRKEPILNGWVTDHDRYVKQNGEQYHSPLKFYTCNGFTVLHNIRLETEKLSAVKITWRRTA